MGNPTRRLMLFTVSSLCLLSLPEFDAARTAPASVEEFYVEGDVYCDVCRLNFVNRLSERMAGSRVRLVCNGEGTNNITYSVEGETERSGHYRLRVQGDHEDEECAVQLVKSSRPDCGEIPDEGHGTKASSKITLTKHNGFHGDTRMANPLSFFSNKAKPECAQLIKELHINDQDLHP